MKNSWDIAIFLCWTERPFHYDIKLIFSQKCHMRRKKLIFFYFVKLNIISSMAIYPDKSKTNILYYVWYLNKHNFVSFFWAKKKYWTKNICHKNLGIAEYAHFETYVNFSSRPWHLGIWKNWHLSGNVHILWSQSFCDKFHLAK